MEGVYVSAAVLSALLVTAVGHALVRTKRVAQEEFCAATSAMTFYVCSPAFSFFNLSRTMRLESIATLVAVALANVAVCAVGLTLATAVSLLLRLDRRTAVYTVAMASFANTSSLPLYLARALYPESKEMLYSLETVYSATQNIIMWGVYYPLTAYWLAHDAPGSGGERAPPSVDRRDVLRRVANPTFIAVMIGLIVGCIRPLQAFLYGPVDFVLEPLLETLSGSQIFLLLLLLGASLDVSPGVAPRKLLVVVIATLRLMLVPAVVFACMAAFPPPSRHFSFIVLTAGATPPNLGLLIMFQVRSGGRRSRDSRRANRPFRPCSDSCRTNWPKRASS